MFLQGKRKGASFLIMVVIMALVMSMFAISVSQLSRSRSSTLISDATEKQVLYLAEDAANQMILQLNMDSSSTAVNLTAASDVGPNYKYDASYTSGTEPLNKGSGTVKGTGYLMNPAYPTDTERAIYSKTVYMALNAPLMVYVRLNGTAQNVPYYRVWNSTTWGATEFAAPAVHGGTGEMYTATNVHLQFITLTFDPGSSKALLGMQDDMGNVWAEEWNGTTSTWSQPSLVYNSGTTELRGHYTRAFDIAYENTNTSGVNRAILVYADKSTAIYRPYYSIWNGTSWATMGQVAAVPAAMTQPYFIELAMNPTTGSKGIGMIYQDSGGRVFGEVWNGTSWLNMSQTTAFGTASSTTGRAVDVAYIQTTGNLLFGYGNTGTNLYRGYTRMWNGSTLAAQATFSANNRYIQWLTLNSVPGTNVVIALYETNNPAYTPYTLYSSTLTGTTWSTTRTTIANGIVYHSYDSQYYDFASGGANKGTVIYSSSTNTLARRTWSGGTTWAAVVTIASSWKRSYTEMAASSTNMTNTLSAYYSNDTSGLDIKELHTDSAGSWNGQTVNNISTGNAANPAYERLAIAIPSVFAAVKGTWRESY